MKPFLLITTGGTIDKVYDPLRGELCFKGSSVVVRLQALGAEGLVEHRAPMAVDSLEMTEDQRREIAGLCHAGGFNRILVTHGTDTMVETAQVIASALPAGVRVVMTGAMVPLSVAGSDGEFHLGAALAHLQGDGGGVFISMHGVLFPAQSCRKDRRLGRFVPKG